MNFPGFSLKNKGGRQKASESVYEQGGSDVVRELSRGPAMFRIGLQGEVLNIMLWIVGTKSF